MKEKVNHSEPILKLYIQLRFTAPWNIGLNSFAHPGHVEKLMNLHSHRAEKIVVVLGMFFANYHIFERTLNTEGK